MKWNLILCLIVSSNLCMAQETPAPESNCEISVPNSFSPNGDGVNDSLLIVMSCPVTKFKFQVFNRWGNTVFESNSIEKSWDGGNEAVGTYFWLIETRDKFEKETSVNGYTTLVR